MIKCETHGTVNEFNITDGLLENEITPKIIARICPHCLVDRTLLPRIKIYTEDDLL